MELRDVVHPSLGLSPFEVGLARDAGGEILVAMGDPSLPENTTYLETLGPDREGVRIVPPRAEDVDERLILGRVGGLWGAPVAGVWGRGNGATTLLWQLAKRFAGKGWKVGVLDADVRHLDLLPHLGLTDPPTAFGRLVLPRLKDGIRLLSLASFTPGVTTLPFRGEALEKLARTYRSDGLWGGPDLLLVDLPDLPDELPRLCRTLRISAVVRLTGPFEDPLEIGAVPVVVALPSPSERGIPYDASLESTGRASGPYERALERLAASLLSNVPKATGRP